MTDLWENYRKPIPVLQWLVVIVLAAHTCSQVATPLSQPVKQRPLHWS